MSKPSEQGYAMVLVLFVIMFFSVLVFGLMAMASGGVNVTVADRDRMSAEFVAQAGAKIAIDEVLNNLKATNGKVLENSGLFTKSATTFTQLDSTSNATFSFSYKPDGSTVDTLSAIEITSNGKIMNYIYTSRVDIVLNTKKVALPGPGVVQLIQSPNATFSGGKWNIDTTDPANPVANPPSSTGFYRVLFGDKLQQQFKITYYGTVNDITNTSASGWGIHYFATGTADSPTSYVFQYDPGAHQSVNGVDDKGSFFVKKVVAGTETWEEWVPYKPAVAEEGHWTRKKVHGVWTDVWVVDTPAQPAVPAHWETRTNKFCGTPFQPNELTADYGKNESEKPDTTYGNGTTKVTLRDLENRFSDFRTYGQKHKITIETSLDADGKLRHKIYLDDYPNAILDFVDNTHLNPIPIENSGTGIRVWNSTCQFYNSPGQSYGQSSSSNIYWRK